MSSSKQKWNSPENYLDQDSTIYPTSFSLELKTNSTNVSTPYSHTPRINPMILCKEYHMIYISPPATPLPQKRDQEIEVNAKIVPNPRDLWIKPTSCNFLSTNSTTPFISTIFTRSLYYICIIVVQTHLLYVFVPTPADNTTKYSRYHHARRKCC